tara:strand:- start:197 stop:430 length:234 start_codon:yes stop_codon:yes gene_type:complete
MDETPNPTPCPYVTGECEYPQHCPDCSTATIDETPNPLTAYFAQQTATADKWTAFYAQQTADFNKAMNRDEDGRPLE